MKSVAVISAYAYIEHHANYGSLLQYYALQEYLKKAGYNPFWIRYVLPEEHTLFYYFKDTVKWLISSDDKKRKKIIKKQNSFIKKYLTLSKEVYCGDKALVDSPPKADYYITGSDQVWGGCIEANYLRFVEGNHPKIAYAASFGKDRLSQEQLIAIPDWIRSFDYVSLRETSGVDICRKLDIQSQLTVDPTLLLRDVDYPVVLPDFPVDFFAYFLNEFPLDCDVESIIRKKNSVICGGVNRNMTSFRRQEKILSPEEWLGMIKTARVVLTNSFHGMIFSIIFKKPFVVFLQKGKTVSQNSRLASFLSTVGLEDRVYKNYDQFKLLLKSKIDWGKVYNKLDSVRLSSMLFLKNALK